MTFNILQGECELNFRYLKEVEPPDLNLMILQ